jgi:hypothetical protein
MKVTWYDSGREPTRPPNRKYPEGLDVDVSRGSSRTCTVPLRYPAKRIGYYLVECEKCQQQALVTTAGRLDDPRSVRITCK